ncbi:MAG: tRNA (N6-threonylcarbamoyladenosine(37)-N6)-methyltransferase TrmO [Candidatus Marinimicrobia bacterium]|nr:tRNA (N6-threonylcarbamoyladenosine(37)-N6)-methyltransferase TrmO [Candidatus Neomarinimicrobiota bacterium]
MKPVIFTPIGIIHSEHKTKVGTPIQPSRLKRSEGKVEIFPAFKNGLKDLAGFSKIWLIYHFHAMEGFKLEVTPYLDDQTRGVFATRAPSRPNPIGLSLVDLVSIEDETLKVSGLDILDGTPLLDIKPFIPDVDHAEGLKVGWLEGKTHHFRSHRADKRF